LRAARGGILAFVNEGDSLAAEALFEVVKRFADDPSAEIVYADHDLMDATGHRSDPFFKPEWDPELLLSTNILGPFTAVRRSLVERVGGLRPQMGAGQPYDFMLRASEQAARISRVAKVLSHLGPRELTRDAILSHHAAARDERRAIEEALARRQRPGCVDTLFTNRGSRCYTTRFRLVSRPLVSIIIPTRNQAGLLKATIDSIVTRTDYDAYEIVVMDNGSRDADALAYLNSLRPPCHVHRWTDPFNYSAINNDGVRKARGQQLLFLNNDVEVIRPDWLTALLEYAQLDAVGAVGAKLLYSDGTIQHAGVVLNVGGVAQHAFRCTAKDVLGAPRLADVPRNCSAVTGACMMVPRRVFDEVGGFDEALRVVLNDIDLCLRIRERRYEVVYTPHSLLFHHEGASRGRLHPAEDEDRFVARWSAQLGRVDPYYNPNLSDTREDWSLKLDT
jgi:GT2 family glycosyltransferase